MDHTTNYLRTVFTSKASSETKTKTKKTRQSRGSSSSPSSPCAAPAAAHAPPTEQRRDCRHERRLETTAARLPAGPPRDPNPTDPPISDPMGIRRPALSPFLTHTHARI
eukprot:GHVU01110507.1.p1 GENE.GHVU01110507.1~~GHVU01110507.1.p1  ORF type:complete len:109 (-),score=12.82 GHVU01110507.1:217-543(-)